MMCAFVDKYRDEHEVEPVCKALLRRSLNQSCSDCAARTSVCGQRWPFWEKYRP
jgi:hypothetical protein